MRLGVLPRAIIVASCFWMVGGTFFIAKSIDGEASATALEHYRDCIKTPAKGVDCLASRDEIYSAHTDQLAGGGLWQFSAGAAAVYLALGLVIFGISYAAFLWVMAGRKQG